MEKGKKMGGNGDEHRRPNGQFSEGYEGGPGRPRGSGRVSFSKACKELLNAKHPKGKTWMEFLAEFAIKAATSGKKGNVEWAKLLIGYSDGKPLVTNLNLNEEATREQQLSAMGDEDLKAHILELVQRRKEDRTH